MKNVSEFSFISTDSSSYTIIYCVQDASFSFDNITGLTIENVVFSSCSVNLLNVTTARLDSIVLQNHSSGAFHVVASYNILILNLTVARNHQSTATIITFKQSQIDFTGQTLIANNTLKWPFNSTYEYYFHGVLTFCPGKFEIEKCLSKNCFDKLSDVIFLVEDCSVTLENLIVTNNFGPIGVMALYSSELQISGNSTFSNNRVCIGGSLSLHSHTSAVFSESMNFYRNRGIRFSLPKISVVSTAGMIVNQSYLTSRGHMEFNRNRGVVTSLFLNLSGALLTSYFSLNSYNGYCCDGLTAILMSRSTLIIQSVTKIEQSKIDYYFLTYTSKLSLSGCSLFYENYNVFYLISSSLALSGEYTFQNNLASSSAAITGKRSSIITMSGDGYFLNNTGFEKGGVIYLNESSLALRNNTSLVFENNTARFGSAIYGKISKENVICKSSLYQLIDSMCLLQIQNYSLLHSIHLAFYGNNAIESGSVLYVESNSNDHNTTLDTFLQISQINESNSKPYLSSSSETLRLCFCLDENDQTNVCNRNEQMINVTKGKSFPIYIKAINLFGLPDTDYVTSTPTGFSVLSESERVQRLGSKCTKLTYTLSSSREQENMTLARSICEDDPLLVEVNLDNSCPIGFKLDSKEERCVCDERILHLLEECDIDSGTFIKKSELQNYWIEASVTAVKFYDNCPFGYCFTQGQFSFNQSQSNSICNHNRTGVLCGQCLEGLSLILGGIRCAKCSNTYLTLIVPFIVLGILLITCLFLTQVTVAGGAINGLIIYANIISANKNAFFTEQFSTAYTIFISWLNLDFGIETCFYKGMDRFGYTMLQFVFPFYLWFLVGLIILLCHYSMRVSKVFGKGNPVAVLATVFLLSYSKLLQTVINIFTVANLQIRNADGNSTESVWYFDGNVEYSDGLHALLIAVASIIFVFAILPFTLIITIDQLFQKIQCPSRILRYYMKIAPFIKMYHEPFKADHRYWIGLSLILRGVLLVIFASVENPKIDLVATSTLCFILISFFASTGGIYKNQWLNILEISFIANLGILSTATFYTTASDDNVHIPTTISVTIALITFIGIVAVHIYKQYKIKFKKVMNVLVEKIKRTKKTENDLHEEEDTSTKEKSVVSSQEVFLLDRFELREPLLEDSTSV